MRCDVRFVGAGSQEAQDLQLAVRPWAGETDLHPGPVAVLDRQQVVGHPEPRLEARPSFAWALPMPFCILPFNCRAESPFTTKSDSSGLRAGCNMACAPHEGGMHPSAGASSAASKDRGLMPVGRRSRRDP